jgi:NADPH:quinone reductase-like Zn-dependent oxidoreductase
VGLDVGALLEPLGVALHAFRRSLMPKDATVVVFGAGAVGLLCAAVAKVKGAKKVIIADIDQGRLDFATQNGFAHASYLVPMKRGADIDENLAIAKETAKAIGEIDSVGEVDVVFECTGVPSCVQAGIFVSHPNPMKISVRADLTIIPVNKARRPSHARRYGSPHSNYSSRRRCATRSRHHRRLPLRQHIRREHRDRTSEPKVFRRS